MTADTEGYTPPRSERLVLGLFDSEEQANRLVERLIEDDFPMDRVSILKRAGGSGDDPFGLVYRDTGERRGRPGAPCWGPLPARPGCFSSPASAPCWPPARWWK